MKKFEKVLSLLCVVCLLCVCCGCAEEGETSLQDVLASGKLVIATSPDFPPFETLDGEDVVGIEIDILNAIAKGMGVELAIVTMDFDSVIPGVQAGMFDVGVSGITITESRKENVDFSEAYFLAAQTIVVKPESNITCKADLEGKKVSVQTGTTAELYCMENGYEVYAYTGNNDAASALLADKVDAWVVDNEVALALGTQLGMRILDESMTTEPYAFAFEKGSDSLVAKFNEILTAMLTDGTIEAIFAEYGVAYVSPVADAE